MTTEKSNATWAEKLLTEVQGFDPAMFPPADKVAAKEKVLGDCPEVAKPFFALARYYRRECERMKLEAGYIPGGLSGGELLRYRQMDQKEDALMEMFWGSVHDGLNTWTSAIGVRAGWKIVETAPPDPRAAIAGLLGVEL